MELHINAAQRLALWVLNKACVSSASLQRASTVSALYSTGDCPGGAN